MMKTENIVCGIYRISSPTDEHYYIGSSNNINRRWKDHLILLKNGTHKNKWLQRRFKGHPEGWKCETVEEVTESDLLTVEQKYLIEHYGKPGCMNVNPVAGKPPAFTKEKAQELSWKEKQREGCRKKRLDPEYRVKLSTARQKLLADPERRAKFIANMNTSDRAAKIKATMLSKPKGTIGRYAIQKKD